MILIKKSLHVPNPPSCYALQHSTLNVELSIIVFVNKVKVKASLQCLVTSQLVLLLLVLASDF